MAFQHMEVELGALMGPVVIGTVAVSIVGMPPVESYLYEQQPCLEVQHNQAAGQ